MTTVSGASLVRAALTMKLVSSTGWKLPSVWNTLGQT